MERRDGMKLWLVCSINMHCNMHGHSHVIKHASRTHDSLVARSITYVAMMHASRLDIAVHDLQAVAVTQLLEAGRVPRQLGSGNACIAACRRSFAGVSAVNESFDSFKLSKSGQTPA